MFISILLESIREINNSNLAGIQISLFQLGHKSSDVMLLIEINSNNKLEYNDVMSMKKLLN